MIEIPLRPEPNQSLQIILGTQNCTLRLITRGESLYSDLAVSDGIATLVWAGVICRNRVGLKLYEHERFRGQLVFVDLESNDDPQWTGLGLRWRLIYLEESEAL